jgi:hypothetical protein
MSTFSGQRTSAQELQRGKEKKKERRKRKGEKGGG